MKHLISMLLLLAFTLSLVVALNIKLGPVPPLGKFFDPFSGFWQNAATTNSYQDHLLETGGLEAEVRVIYDSLMIPHIFARNDHDLFFAQGFVTASHRLWQMEFQTHFAAGRLSEIFGKNSQVLRLDRLHRRIGLEYGADNSLKVATSHPLSKAAIEAYAEGVNAFINALDTKTLPIEYKLFNYRPEKWTAKKTSLLLKYMANNLAGRDYDLKSTNTLNIIGKEAYDFLFPVRDRGIDPVIPKGTPWNFSPLKTKDDSLSVPEDITSAIIEMPDPDNGSNNWAVSGKKTASGNPILAGDPHLGLNLPSIWFAIQLHSPDMNVMGVSLPGAMGVIIGFNDSIAWSLTNSRRDVRDWYKIKFRTPEKNEYFHDGQWKPARKVIDTVFIRNQPPFIDTVIYTHHGPVVYDEQFMPENKKQNYALRWVAHDGSNEALSFYLLNRAKNYREFNEAMDHFACPAQNFAFACANGDIAIRVQGKFPLKRKGQGQFLMDGTLPQNDWQDFIPPEHNARILNPPRGFVSSANQFPVDSTYPYFVYDGNYEHYRNRRINQRLEEMDHITPADMQALQNDNFNMKASESLPVLLSYLNRENLPSPAQDHLESLESWDFYNEPELVAPAVFNLWWSQFFKTFWDEFDADSLLLRTPSTPQTIYLMRHDTVQNYADIKETPEIESLQDVVTQSYLTAVSELEAWKETSNRELNWGNYKYTSVNHLVPQLAAFSEKGIITGGGKNIVNATRGRHGPSWKMVTELGDEVKAWAIYPGGQSGNPGSPYYSNFIPVWAKGRYHRLLFMKHADEKNNALFYTQTLQ